MKKKLKILIVIYIVCFLFQHAGKITSFAEAKPSTWTAVDGLGRSLSEYGDEGIREERSDRFVGMFYWTWHVDFANSVRPRNVQSIIENYPAAKNDYNHSAWQGIGGYHFWNEPLFGYYNITDKYVLRKHAELLADAGVDVIIFDCTNGSYLWTPGYKAVLETFAEARSEGVKTPQVAFILNFGAVSTTAEMLRNLYNDLYSKNLYKDLWFQWKGKPLIMAYPEALSSSATDQTIKSFFTFRRPQPEYNTGNFSNDLWGWLAIYPQPYYGTEANKEQTTVGVAQNADYLTAETNKLTAMNGTNVMGRSYAKGSYSYKYTYAGKTVTVNSSIQNSKLYGLNFQQQWDRAIQLDTEFVFVTGWNEWVAIRQESWGGVSNAFADQFNDEYSRDIEPTKGDLKDHYYYQLVENIRRYKGVAKTEKISSAKAIDINGNVSQWNSVTAFDHYTNSTRTRNTRGYVGTSYTNNTMRNDIVTTKIAYDTKNIYFYVQTKNNLTDPSGKAWMRLFLDTDPTGNSKNWEGFEYVLNRVNPSSSTCRLEKSTGGWNWSAVGEVSFSVKGNVLQVEIPRSMLGLTGSTIDFSFKWADNMQTDGDILDFYANGDVAPGGRFAFHYLNSAESGVPTPYPTKAPTPTPVKTPTPAATKTPANEMTPTPSGSSGPATDPTQGNTQTDPTPTGDETVPTSSQNNKTSGPTKSAAPGEEDDPSPKNNALLIGIVIGDVVLAGAGAGVIVYFMKKKKNS